MRESTAALAARHGLGEIVRLALSTLESSERGLAERAQDIACAHQILAETASHALGEAEHTTTHPPDPPSGQQARADRDDREDQPADVDELDRRLRRRLERDRGGIDGPRP